MAAKKPIKSEPLKPRRRRRPPQTVTWHETLNISERRWQQVIDGREQLTARRIA